MPGSENKTTIQSEATVKKDEQDETALVPEDIPPAKQYTKTPESLEDVEARLLREVNMELEDTRNHYERQNQDEIANKGALKYKSFDSNKIAQQYMVNIENYNELNMFDFKNSFRGEL